VSDRRRSGTPTTDRWALGTPVSGRGPEHDPLPGKRASAVEQEIRGFKIKLSQAQAEKLIDIFEDVPDLAEQTAREGERKARWAPAG
jgi:hypothetical protein